MHYRVQLRGGQGEKNQETFQVEEKDLQASDTQPNRAYRVSRKSRETSESKRNY
jgi:hypothetical protein